MKRVSYILTLGIVYPLSLLPFWVLYGLSNILFLLAYYVIKYRRKVVATNISNAFPEKTAAERKAIGRQFYVNLCDIIVEDIKFITVSPNEIKKRLQVKNIEVLNQLNTSAITTLGHCGNWEMAGLAASYELQHHHSIAIYRSLSNPYFDQLMKKIRARFGLELIAHTQSRLIMSQLASNNNIYHFITDQVPTEVKTAYWTQFLNQDTPIYLGAEKIAMKANLPVYYLKILRTKRGHYSMEIQEVVLNPKKSQQHEITELHTRLLENNIREQPDNWLWSHRRWKKQRP